MKLLIGVSVFAGLILINVVASFGSENCHGLYSPGNSYGCGVGNGNCTWYAAYRRPDLNFPKISGHSRNAGQWKWYAEHFGYVVKNVPVPGAVVVLNMGNYGHVVYVEDRYQGPITVDYGLPFIATEQDYTGSFNYKFVGHKTFRAIYAFSHNGHYRRQNSEYGFGAENEVYGFIYPTRTVKYANDYRLVLMRKDGAIPQSCNQVDQATMYLLSSDRQLTVIKFGNKNWAQLMCMKSNDGGPLQDTDDIASYIARRRGSADVTDGIGGSYVSPSGNYTPAPGSGAVEHPQNGESDHAGYVHNVSMGDVEIAVEGDGDYHHSLTFNHGEVPMVKIHTRLKNKTNHEN